MQQPYSEPANDRHVPSQLERRMKIVVIVLGIILFIGFVIVIGTIAYRIANPDGKEKNAISQMSPPKIPTEIEVNRPADSSLVAVTGDSELVYLHFRTADGGDQIVIVNIATGAVQSTVTVTDP